MRIMLLITEALDAARKKLEEEQGKRLFTIIPTEKNWTLR
jgi:hypothetical protein